MRCADPSHPTVPYSNEEAVVRSGEKVSFGFGANWQRFTVDLDDTVLDAAVESFCEFAKITSLRGETFLDLGCGSGLSSLVAARLDADRIVSVDIDPNSVAATISLRQRCDISDSRWTVGQGSALDRDFLASLGRFSYVYSWGVLHHTGAMWEALTNVAESSVQPGGRLHLALYNKHRTSEVWLRIKRACNRWPGTFRPLFKATYVSSIFGKMLLRSRWPRTFLKDYRARRGMSYFRDVDDWLGGLPYEYCLPEEAIDFLAAMGYRVEQLKTTTSCGCNEYLFLAAEDDH